MDRYVRGVVVAMAALAVAWAVMAAEQDRLPLGDPSRAFLLGAARVGEVYDTAAGRTVSLDEAVERLAGADIVLLGEDHTHMGEKRFQARVLEALAVRGRPVVLGLEFFTRDDADALARWSAGTIGEEEFLFASGWLRRGSYPWAYYRPVMEVARRYHLPVVGLNVPRRIVHAVAQGGLGALAPEDRELVGEVDVSGSPAHRYLVAQYFGEAVAQMPPEWFDRMYAAQCVWDVVMARAILDALPEGGQVVAVAGSGHVAHGLGIPRRLQELAARRGVELRVATVCPVLAQVVPEGEALRGHPTGRDEGEGNGYAAATFSRGLADIVAVFGDELGVEAVPRLGVSLKERGDAVTVSRVWPDTLGARAGLERGDVVVRAPGWRAGQGIERLRLELGRLRWWTRIELAVERDGDRVTVPILLVPEVESVERSVLPGWTVSELWGWSPDGAAPASVPSRKRRRQLYVRDPGGTARVVEYEDRLAVAVHELDADGRVVRTLLREPGPDGAVELLYRRGPGGAVERAERHPER